MTIRTVPAYSETVRVGRKEELHIICIRCAHRHKRTGMVVREAASTKCWSCGKRVGWCT